MTFFKTDAGNHEFICLVREDWNKHRSVSRTCPWSRAEELLQDHALPLDDLRLLHKAGKKLRGFYTRMVQGIDGGTVSPHPWKNAITRHLRLQPHKPVDEFLVLAERACREEMTREILDLKRRKDAKHDQYEVKEDGVIVRLLNRFLQHQAEEDCAVYARQYTALNSLNHLLEKIEMERFKQEDRADEAPVWYQGIQASVAQACSRKLPAPTLEELDRKRDWGGKNAARFGRWENDDYGGGW